MWINSKSGSVVAGNATKDPEYKCVGSKKTSLLKLSIAIGKDEQGNNTYADIAAWGKLAERLNELCVRKGDPIAAFGVWAKKDSNGKTYWTLNADYVCAFGNGIIMSTGPVDTSPEIGTPDGIDFGDMPDFMK